MRVLLVGMHRSGTSALARVLNLMGLHLGEERELMPPKPDNPAGFWERADVHELHEELFATLGTAWHTVSEDDVGRLDAANRRRFEHRLRAIVDGLDRHRPWLVKDPRLCLLLPLWRAVVPDPVVVLIVRRPVQVAQSIATRNGFELPVGVGLWEEHTTASLRHTADLPRVLVTHHELMAQPKAVADRLFGWLAGLGVSGIRRAEPEAIAEFIRADLYRARGDETTEAPYLNPGRRQLLESLLDGTALDRPAPTLSADARDLLATHRRAVAAAADVERLRAERDAIAAVRARLEGERDAARAELGLVVPERMALFAEKNALLEERDALFAEKNALLAGAAALAGQRDALFEEKNALLTERNALFEQRNAAAAEGDALFAEKSALLAEVAALAGQRDALFEEKNAYLEERDALFVAKGELLAQLATATADRDALFAEVHTLRSSNARLFASLDSASERLEQLRDQLGMVLSGRDYLLGRALLDPLRAVRRRLTRRRS